MNICWMNKIPCIDTKMLKGQKYDISQSVSACQVRLVLLQLKGLEDGYNEELSFPIGSMSFNPFGFL